MLLSNAESKLIVVVDVFSRKAGEITTEGIKKKL